MKFLGRRLTQERKRMGLSQAATAELGGVRPNAQAHYESGKRKPDANYLASVFEAGIDISYVLTGYRADGPHLEAVQTIMNELHDQLWSTAKMMTELSQLLNPSDGRTPRDHLIDYIRFLDRNNLIFPYAVIEWGRITTSSKESYNESVPQTGIYQNRISYASSRNIYQAQI
ncbi:helix-turn-helix transcriptional regulator [Xanthomonas sp. WHRI 1810A]|uniref:helix-turn-helix domain-containing protein n=1 Tax=Xanthomonas sp. WHRI 1810A TaxID=3161565 RepID=UPI0032E8BD48